MKKNKDTSIKQPAQLISVESLLQESKLVYCNLLKKTDDPISNIQEIRDLTKKIYSSMHKIRGEKVHEIIKVINLIVPIYVNLLMDNPDYIDLQEIDSFTLICSPGIGTEKNQNSAINLLYGIYTLSSQLTFPGHVANYDARHKICKAALEKIDLQFSMGHPESESIDYILSFVEHGFIENALKKYKEIIKSDISKQNLQFLQGGIFINAANAPHKKNNIKYLENIIDRFSLDLENMVLFEKKGSSVKLPSSLLGLYTSLPQDMKKKIYRITMWKI